MIFQKMMGALNRGAHGSGQPKSYSVSTILAKFGYVIRAHLLIGPILF